MKFKEIVEVSVLGAQNMALIVGGNNCLDFPGTGNQPDCVRLPDGVPIEQINDAMSGHERGATVGLPQFSSTCDC